MPSEGGVAAHLAPPRQSGASTRGQVVTNEALPGRVRPAHPGHRGAHGTAHTQRPLPPSAPRNPPPLLMNGQLLSLSIISFLDVRSSYYLSSYTQFGKEHCQRPSKHNGKLISKIDEAIYLPTMTYASRKTDVSAKYSVIVNNALDNFI